MTPEEIKKQVEIKLKTSPINAKVYLDRFNLIDESSRITAAYNDARYAPFYYHLGKLIQPKNMVEFGFRLGLLSGCFLKSCQTVEKFLAFQELSEHFYSDRIGKSNIKKVYKHELKTHIGHFYDDEWQKMFQSNQWDVIFINEEMKYDEHMERLESIWGQISYDGLLIMDYINFHKPAKDSYFNFCKLKGRRPISIDTRYGVGVIQK